MASPSTSLAIRQFQSDTELVCSTPQPRGVSLAVWLLVGLIVAATAVACTVSIDKIVASTGGRIVSSRPLNVVQALDPSVIKTLDVKEGQTVAAGQLLATLDSTFAQADVGQLVQQVAGLQAQIARAQAEMNRTAFAPDLKAGGAVGGYLLLQKGLFDQRAASYAAQLTSFDEKIKQQQATVVKLQTDEDRYQEREKISQKVQDMRDTLYKSGSSSFLNLLQATDQKLEMQRTREFGHNSMIEAQHQITSLTADRDAFVQKWFSDLSQESVTARNNLDQAEGQLAKAARHQDLVRLVAAEPGVVLSLAKVSVGSVLKQGDSLMTVMPLGSPVEAEVNIASRDIGFLKVGDDARLKVDAFNSAEHGYADGRVLWVSEDSFTTDADNKPAEPYYKSRISIEAMHFEGVPAGFRLIPGMTLTADVKVGTRLLGRYLLGGTLRGASEAMREP